MRVRHASWYQRHREEAELEVLPNSGWSVWSVFVASQKGLRYVRRTKAIRLCLDDDDIIEEVMGRFIEQDRRGKLPDCRQKFSMMIQQAKWHVLEFLRGWFHTKSGRGVEHTTNEPCSPTGEGLFAEVLVDHEALLFEEIERRDFLDQFALRLEMIDRIVLAGMRAGMYGAELAQHCGITQRQVWVCLERIKAAATDFGPSGGLGRVGRQTEWRDPSSQRLASLRKRGMLPARA